MSTNKRCTSTILSTLSIGMMVLPQLAFAGGSGSMPWETPLDTIATSLTGPVARSIGICAVVATGLAFAFTEGGGILRKAVGVLFGLAIVFSASTFISTLFGAAAGGGVPW